MPRSFAAPVLLAAALSMFGSSCGPVATTEAERARTFSPTPGAPALRSVASDTQCRLLERPAELPDVAQVVDTSALSVAFANEPNLAFGVVFDRAGGVDEVRRLEATTRTVEERRVHVSVGVVGRVDAVFMPQAHDADAEAEVRRGYDAARFTVATLNGEAVPSVVLFGTRHAPARPRR